MTLKRTLQSPPNVDEERDKFCKEAIALKAENEALRKCLEHTEDLAHALENQRDEMHHLLIRAQMTIVRLGGQMPRALKGKPTGNEDLWLPCDWLSEAAHRDVLGTAENHWMEGNPQAALTFLDCLLGQATTVLYHRVLAKLLKSAVLRHCYGQGERAVLEKAMTQIDEAVEIVRSYRKTYDIQGKVQFHRGMCLYELGRFQEAKLAFSTATGTRLHESRVEKWKALVKKALQESQSDRGADKPAPAQLIPKPADAISLFSPVSGDLSVSAAAEIEERIHEAAEGTPLYCDTR